MSSLVAILNTCIVVCFSPQRSAISVEPCCVCVPCRDIRFFLAPTTCSCILTACPIPVTVLQPKLCSVCSSFTLPSIWQWSLRVKLQQSRSRRHRRCNRCGRQAKRPAASHFDTACPQHHSIAPRRASCNSDDPPGRKHGESREGEGDRSRHSAEKR